MDSHPITALNAARCAPTISAAEPGAGILLGGELAARAPALTVLRPVRRPPETPRSPGGP